MYPRFARILLNLFLLTLLSAAAATAQDRPLYYSISGRVVDEEGKGVAGALVGMRVPEPQSPDAFHTTIADKDGRFRAGDSARTRVDYATFWVSAPLTDAHAPVDFMFGSLSYLDSSFEGQKVTFGDDQLQVDLGDVRVQARYSKVEIRILDRTGSPLSRDSKDFDKLRLLIRDARGEVINEGGVAEAAKRKDKSSIILALPQGTWEIAVSIFNDSFNWTPLAGPIVIARGGSVEIQQVTVKLSDFDCATLPTASDAAGRTITQEEARLELAKRKLKLTEDEFVERARMGNREVVKLFLAAGMNVNAGNKRGQTALIAAAGPWSGHLDVLCALISAGADVNARDMEGQTALLNSASMVNSRVMETLLNNGADVNVQNNRGWTALMFASQSGQANTVKVLLGAGANVSLKNNEGKTALQVAFRHEGNEVASLLEKAAARKETPVK
ncbi:MAG TPA: ankyrin repeat domain-containing protein [Pyrinomonadaceae bacterium]|nr:ankyrin repeat domain-containing protein [Pyrinomonadaceae bacterium]